MDECPDSLQTCGVLLTKYNGALPLNGLLVDMNRYSLSDGVCIEHPLI